MRAIRAGPVWFGTFCDFLNPCFLWGWRRDRHLSQGSLRGGCVKNTESQPVARFWSWQAGLVQERVGLGFCQLLVVGAESRFCTKRVARSFLTSTSPGRGERVKLRA